MPHRPEDTEGPPPRSTDRPGEVKNPPIEPSHEGGPRVTGDTQPPKPSLRGLRRPGAGERHRE